MLNGMIYFTKKEGIGYFVEYDLDYPENLYDLQNDYPLAPEKIVVQDEWLSSFCKKIKKKSLIWQVTKQQN